MRSVETPSVEVTEEMIATIVGTGGYTHPLFNPDADERAAGRAVPLPGQGVLLLMGGLVEQSGALDDAIAMVELRRARFRSMVTAGSSLKVVITPVESTTTSSGKVLSTYQWLCTDGNDAEVAEAEVLMLMNNAAPGGGS